METSPALAVLLFTMLMLMVLIRGEHYLANNTKSEAIYQTKTTKSKEHHDHKCDLYTGKWVYDSSYPLYDAGECPFIENQFSCEGNGRRDNNFLKFSWKPSHCLLPRFDGVEFLERLRGKRIMFVGDSISLNQWQSLVCMLHTASPNALYAITRSGSISEFSFPEHNASLMLMRDAFLVKVVDDKKLGKILDLNTVSYGKSWKGIDVLIFNSWHWWLHSGRKQLWDYIKDGEKLFMEMDRLVAYEKGLRTWARWVDKHLDTSRTNVFFQGVSPDHMDALNWKAPKAKTCVGVTQPELRLVKHSHPGEQILEKVISEMRRPIKLLRITTMSDMRRDGHPGVYGIGKHKLPDCSHWCLPGVPDTWNHLLYTSLLNSSNF